MKLKYVTVPVGELSSVTVGSLPKRYAEILIFSEFLTGLSSLPDGPCAIVTVVKTLNRIHWLGSSSIAYFPGGLRLQYWELNSAVDFDLKKTFCNRAINRPL